MRWLKLFLFISLWMNLLSLNSAFARDPRPFLPALDKWMKSLTKKPSQYQIRSIETKVLRNHTLYLVSGDLYWHGNTNHPPSDFAVLFYSVGLYGSVQELYRVSDRNTCGSNTYEAWQVSSLPQFKNPNQWLLDFRFSSFGCGSGDPAVGAKVLNHFYLVVNESPDLNVVYQSQFLINSEYKFLPRNEDFLVVEIGAKEPGQSNILKREIKLKWDLKEERYLAEMKK